ncbi:type VI secretion system tip protein VgrG [Saccharophagus sp. K07]|uniref:type VI secretion system Vgr family protein n=1 Tax=Saccharophagus sp. K07 TaxID=2283636 RepID=UPI00165244D1
MAIDFTPAKFFTQETRHLRVQSNLGTNALLLRRFSGVEGISRLFHLELDLLSHNGAIKPQDIVGDKIGITIEPEGESKRVFSGFVKSFQYSGLEKRGLYSYKAEVVPWFWFLGKRTDCRVFQNQTVQEIVEFIFNELGFSDYVFALIEQHPKIEYCVQYNESDLDFISRLLEHEGIYYFFEHQEDKCIMHFSDDASHYTDLSPRLIEHSSGVRQKHYIRQWQHLYQYCSGAYAQTDFNFEKFNQSLLTETPTTIKLKNNANFARFEFPGSYRENEQGRVLTKLRMQQEEMNYERITAASNVNTLEVGKKFTLKSDENEADHGNTYVITEIRHSAYDPSYLKSENDEPPYTNHFVCIPASTTFRPAMVTPRPRIDGVQTAVVVGKAGDEIYTDKYGRIKIQFHWDRYGAKDETSSCWVRVSTPWAGNKWGSVTIPRVGQEVIVTFVNGDPDQPLVIGSLYNSAHMPPYPLPEGKSMMGMKSRSVKGDGGSYNEMVIDDTKGSEGFRVNAQKDYDMKVGNNSNTHVLNDHTGKVDGNSTTTVQGNSTHTTQGNDSFTVNGNRTATVDGNEDSTVQGNATVTVVGNKDATVNGNTTFTVGGNDTVAIGAKQEVSVASKQTISVGADQETVVGSNQMVQVGGKQEIFAMSQTVGITTDASLGAMKITQVGETEITLAVGASVITLTPAEIKLSVGTSSVTIDMSGVSVQGPKVNLN